MLIPSPQKVEHELALYYCKKCGHQESANVPNALPNMKFDINTLLLMSYFGTGLNVSLDGIARVFRDVFHVGISKSTVSNDLTKLRKYLGNYYTELEKEVKNAAVRYKDETSVRNDGKTFWMWVVSKLRSIQSGAILVVNTPEPPEEVVTGSTTVYTLADEKKVKKGIENIILISLETIRLLESERGK